MRKTHTEEEVKQGWQASFKAVRDLMASGENSGVCRTCFEVQTIAIMCQMMVDMEGWKPALLLAAIADTMEEVVSINEPSSPLGDSKSATTH